MQCIKCGCEIPEGELFCTACSLTPGVESMAKPQKKVETKPVLPPAPKVEKPPVRQESTPPKKKISKLLIPFILVFALCITMGYYIVKSYDDLARQSRALQVRDADLNIKEKDFRDTEEALKTANTQLEESKGQIYDLQQEVERLEEEALAWNSVASQSEFDLDTQKQEMELLTQENTQLVETVQTLEENVSDLENETKEQAADLKIARSKANFMDRYVVFVNNEDGEEYYHSYDCSHFNKSNFFAYNTKLAVSRGYSPCPYCKD